MSPTDSLNRMYFEGDLDEVQSTVLDETQVPKTVDPILSCV